MTAFLEIFDYIALVLCAGAGFFASLRFVHMLQLESYQAPMYLKWLKKNILRDWAPPALIALICILLDAALLFASRSLGVRLPVSTFLLGQCAIRIIYVGLMLFLALTWVKQPAKKPLAYTGRVKRLCAAIAAVILLVSASRWLFRSGDILSAAQYLFLRGTFYLPALLLPLVVWAAHLCMLPVEEANKRRYFNDAKRRLAARTDITRIGITGSYGKTSTKNFLHALLSARYNVLMTPENFNTPMGLVRTIREHLNPAHQIFLAEMGAKNVGDIQELCDLVHPQYGIITSVGEQHLETFGSVDNILNTKFELADALPSDGRVFLNMDNERIFDRAPDVKVPVTGYGNIRGDYRADRITQDASGTHFIVTAPDGSEQAFTTRLLGAHNIQNLAGCIAVAHSLGIPLKELVYPVRMLRPVEHRLQLRPGGIIDDAYNSNPAGFRSALEVLRDFAGQRVLVTPGMVELGERQDALNRELGVAAADCCDYAVLVGERQAPPLKEGLLSAGFDPSRIFVAHTLQEGLRFVQSLSAEGPRTILLENDLPDNF